MAAARKKRRPSRPPASPNRHARARRLDTRLRQLFEVLQKGGFPNATTLARKLEVCTRTIRRDIELLRDYHHIGIQYDESRYGFFLTDPSQPFPGAAFTESELLALIIARQSLAAHRGSPLEQILSDGFHRLQSRLDNEQTYTLDTLGSLISFHDLGHEDLSTETFHIITSALRTRREILFHYQGLKDAKPRERRVHPYHLGNHNQKWYLFALDPASKSAKDAGIRSFALSRITQLRLGTATFQRPANFNPAQHLKGSFGIHSGDPTTEIEVIIQFDAWATRLVQERQWHASQDLIHHTDPPGCTLTLRLTSTAEVKRWILSWGEHATVLAPPQLQEELRHAAYSILANTPSRTAPRLP